MTEREVLKLALECAERCESIDGMYSWADTITAIKEVLAQPKQEPETLNYTVHVECKRCGSHERYDLEIDNPQRTWVGLTDEEICPWFQENTALTNEAAMRITRAIEAKLKSKNGYDT